MITHLLPEIPKSSGAAYNESSAGVLPWEDGKYIVSIYLKGYGVHGFAPLQVFVADAHQLTPVVQHKGQLDTPNDSPGGVYAAKDEHPACVRYYRHNTPYQMRIPDRIRISQPPDSLCASGSNLARKGKLVLAGGSLCGGYSTNLFEALFPDLRPSRGEVVAFTAHNPHAFQVSRLQIASQWFGEVLSVAIAKDGLTAAALVSCKDQPWELTIWDLDQ